MTEPLLTVEGLTYRSAEGVLVLDGVRFALARGEVVDITGPSGSGKTTFLRAMARLLPGAAGNLALDGRPAADVVAAQWRSRVALLPQSPAIVCGTVRENLLLPWALKVRVGDPPPDDAALERALASVGLGDEIALARDSARLSVGQGARVALLRVLLTGPDVLLLDEPDAALDDASAEQVSAVTVRLASQGAGVVRVRHRRSDAGAARRMRLAEGRLTEVTA